MTIADDLRAAIKQLEDEPYRPAATIHHPNCDTLRTGDLADCRCGGWAFPR